MRTRASRFAGAANELLVAADLFRRGFFVYRGESAESPFDLVAYLDGALLKIEVRQVGRRLDGSISPQLKETDDCDLYAFVAVDREIVYISASTARADRRQIRPGGDWRVAVEDAAALLVEPFSSLLSADEVETSRD